MIDFIFQVDLSTIYIINRRDYSSPVDKTGVSTLPLGGKFYYTAAEANAAARHYCTREATKAGTIEAVVHGDRESLYRGACVVREHGRERFEVIVRRLRASGHGSGAMRGESRGSVMVGTGRTEDRRRSWSERRPETAESVVSARKGSSELVGGRRMSLGGEKRPGTGNLMAVEEESSSSTEESGSAAGEKRGSRIGRFWGTLRRK